MLISTLCILLFSAFNILESGDASKINFWWVLLAIALNPLFILFKTLSNYLMLDSSQSCSFFEFLRIQYRAYAIASATFTGNIGGDISLFSQIRKFHEKKSALKKIIGMRLVATTGAAFFLIVFLPEEFIEKALMTALAVLGVICLIPRVSKVAQYVFFSLLATLSQYVQIAVIAKAFALSLSLELLRIIIGAHFCKSLLSIPLGLGVTDGFFYFFLRDDLTPAGLVTFLVLLRLTGELMTGSIGAWMMWREKK